MKTIFCDIDGVLFEHPGSLDNVYNVVPAILEGTHKKLQEWHMKGYYIVLTTSRLPSLEAITKAQLEHGRIPYHQLVMGINRGTRIVINDSKPDSLEPMAVGISLTRNHGIKELDI